LELEVISEARLLWRNFAVPVKAKPGYLPVMKAGILISAAWVALSSTGLADMGSIPFKAGTRVFEPSQNAIIAWNGREEVMLLATELRASAKTKVLEVMPVPSKPSVTKGEFRSFVLANNLIRWKTRNDSGGSSDGVDPFAGDLPERRPAGRVVEHKRIGTHDLRIAEVLNEKGFTDWALDYLTKQGAPEPTIPQVFKDVIAEYLQDGYRWFVFDVVELGPELVKKDVLRFHFRTDYLYFPLRITRVESGDTLIKLLILTHDSLANAEFAGLAKGRITLPARPVKLYSSEVSAIDKAAGTILPNRISLLRTWEIKGALDGFDRDLLVGLPSSQRSPSN
jgi:hypothetical protein